MFDMIKTPDHTTEMNPAEIQNNKWLGILSYLSWLVLVPVCILKFTKSENYAEARASRFVQFHANQGLVLAITSVLAQFVLNRLGKLPLIGWCFGIVGFLFSLVVLLMVIFGIVNVCNGQAKELPIIGGIRLLK